MPSAPLVRVIAQVRFPPVLNVGKSDFIADFQEAIRSEYPVLRPEARVTLAFPPEGAAAGPRKTTWRFCKPDDTWRASLAPGFVALETTSYVSRDDFLDHLGTLVEAVQEHIKPALVQRFGLRYIDRIEGEATERIDTLIRPEMLGILATSLSSHVQHSLGETLLVLPGSEDRLRVRWGRIPPKGTVDPEALEPVDAPSWVLDLDMFSEAERPFCTEAIRRDGRRYAERIYAMFRWAVTDEFLRRYGGKP